MHSDLSPHLHTPECNQLIEALFECHKQNTFGKFLGACNGANDVMLKCLRAERENRRKLNHEKAIEKQSKVRVRVSEE